MKWFSIQTHYFALLLHCILFVQGKVVYLNGTEIPDDNLKNVSVTTAKPLQKSLNVFIPKNISNHSENPGGSDFLLLKRKNDEKEKVGNNEEEQLETVSHENDQSFDDALVTRDTTVLSTLRGIWDGLTPIVTILSTIIGLFFIFVLIQSPLSPLPVPPLPYPPIGPFPPTNIYPYGVPPHVGNHHDVRFAGTPGYAGPVIYPGPIHGGYRVPRKIMLATEKDLFKGMVERVADSIIKSNSTNVEELMSDFFKAVISELCTYPSYVHHFQKIEKKKDVEGKEEQQNAEKITEGGKKIVVKYEDNIKKGNVFVEEGKLVGKETEEVVDLIVKRRNMRKETEESKENDKETEMNRM